MKKSIKIMSILTCVSLLMCTEPIFADEIAADHTVMLTTEEMAVVTEKKELRAAHLHDDIQSELIKQGISAAERKTKVDELFISLTSKVNSSKEQSDIVKQLGDLGVYILESSLSELGGHDKTLSVRSSEEYIELRGVVISYDSYNDSWILVAGGNWDSSEEWIDDIPFLGTGFAYEGLEIDLGGKDGVGIRLYDTYGTFNPTRLEDSYIYVSDGNGNSHFSESRSANVNQRDGVFFEFQDYVTCLDSDYSFPYLYSQWSYYGKHFSVTAIYSSDFENYHGYADIYYTHTWSSTEIENVTISGSELFEVTFLPNSNNFEASSGSVTIF